jgi:hypothetical protein
VSKCKKVKQNLERKKTMNPITVIVTWTLSSLLATAISHFSGNAHRAFTDGMLAWLFMPLGFLSCLFALGSEGFHGVKTALHEYSNTLFNRDDQAGGHPAHD